MLTGLDTEHVDAVTSGKATKEQLLLRKEGAVKLARWLRALVPLIIAVSAYVGVACSPFRSGFCDDTLSEESMASPIGTIHEFLK